MFLLLALACTGSPDDTATPDTDADTDSDTDTDTDSDTDTDTDTDTDADTDSDTDADTDTDSDTDSDTDTDTGCGEDGICELTVTNVTLGYADPTDAHVIAATVSGAHQVDVDDYHFADGCCPTISVTAVANARRGTVEPTYSISADDCDCYTGLSLTYTLSGVPSGSWELTQGGVSVVVEVP